MLRVDCRKVLHGEAGLNELHVRLEAENGECIGIKGVTGSGKTTLFKMISGLVEPDSGAISFGESVWWQKSPKKNVPARKRDIGYCMQHGVIYNHMTVKKNIMFGGASAGFADELLNLVGMHTFRDSLPHTLSGGQRQRLIVARAFAKEHNLILLDEPFSALDSETAWHMADIIKTIQAVNRTTTIVVSHNDRLLSMLADKICPLKDGKLYEAARSPASAVCTGMLRVINLSKQQRNVSA